jgi:hypothetical protein
MAGPALASQLNVADRDAIQVTVATETDDAGIRRLLRQNPMPGSISISMEREPSYFAEEWAWDAMEASEDARDHRASPFRQTIIARHRDRIVGAGSCSFHRRFINGRPCRVGYLSGLRLDAAVAGRFTIARRGYQRFEALQRPDPADFYFTTIAADNERSLRVLERGLPGMPKYRFVCDFITALIPVPRSSGTRTAARAEVSSSELSDFLNRRNREFQLAPCWTPGGLIALARLGLKIEDFAIVREGSGMVACAALWDQRCFKQTVIRGYAPTLTLARPFINGLAKWLHRPVLPAVDSTLAHAVVSHLAAEPGRPRALRELIKALLPIAAARGIGFLTIGFAELDPRLALLRADFSLREYRTKLYSVQWPDFPMTELDQNVCFPDVALL